MGRRLIFQQDNDSKHTAKKTKKLLSDRCPGLLDWPSNSPDLNPIKNLWSILKERIEKQVNKLVLKKNLVTVNVFCKIIQKEWEGIEPEIFLNLACSMKSRIELVIESEG